MGILLNNLYSQVQVKAHFILGLHDARNVITSRPSCSAILRPEQVIHSFTVKKTLLPTIFK